MTKEERFYECDKCGKVRHHEFFFHCCDCVESLKSEISRLKAEKIELDNMTYYLKVLKERERKRRQGKHDTKIQGMA